MMVHDQRSPMEWSQLPSYARSIATVYGRAPCVGRGGCESVFFFRLHHNEPSLGSVKSPHRVLFSSYDYEVGGVNVWWGGGLHSYLLKQMTNNESGARLQGLEKRWH